MSENKVNEAITEIFESLERTLPRKNGQVVRTVDKARLLVADVLAKYTNKDGVIPRNKVNAVLSDLQAVEAEIYRMLRDELRLILQESAGQTTLSLTDALIAIYGAAELLEYANLSGIALDVVEESAELLFHLLTKSSYKKHVDSVVESSFNRKGETDDYRLNDRLRNIAYQLREEVSETLRQTIRNGEGTSDTLREVGRRFEALAWRIHTIVETEILFASRQTLAWFAEKSGMVSALRIIDFPHGSPGEHERHKCHVYAHANEHNLGEGVYPVSVRKIRHPHPRCRAKLFFVMTDEFK